MQIHRWHAMEVPECSFYVMSLVFEVEGLEEVSSLLVI